MRSSVAHSEVLASTALGAVRVLWLAEVEIAGVTFRVSSEDVDVTDANGEEWLFRAGLLDLVHEIGVDGMHSISLSLAADVAGVRGGWPAVLSRHKLPRPPHGGRARLIRWVYGQVLEAARVWFDGVITNCEHGGATSPISVGVDRPTAQVRRFPPELAVVDQRTWPSSASYQVDESLIGAVYPVVIGKPGGTSLWGSLTLLAHASPAYLVDYCGAAHLYGATKLLVGWVPDGTSYVDTTVSVMDVSGGSAAPGGLDGAWTMDQSMTLAYTTDLLGRKVAYIAPESWQGWGETLSLRPGGEFYIKFSLGGVYNTERTGALRKCGEYIGWLLQQCGVPVDQGRMQAARGRLDRYLLDFTHTESIDGEQFIQAEIGKFIPLARRTSAEGVWYELLRYDAHPADAVLHLVAREADPEAWGYVELDEDDQAPQVAVVRQGNVRWVPDFDDVINDFTVRYAPTRGSEPTLRVMVTGDEPDLDLASAVTATCGSAVCAASKGLYGTRASDPLEVRLVHDVPTATMIALDRAMRHAVPRRVIAYAGSVVDLETLEPGDVVRVTDSEQGVDGSLALVMRMTVGLGAIGLELELLDHLALVCPVMPDEVSIVEEFAPQVMFRADRVVHSSGTISQITDQSGNGNHATVVTGSAPTWSASYDKFGGRPAIVCSAGQIATTATFADGDLTLVVGFYDPGVTGSWEAPVGFQYTTNISWFRDNATDPNQWTVGVIEPGAPYGQVVTANDGAAHVIVLVRRGSTHEVWVDGVLAASKTGSAAATTAAVMAVGGGPSAGYFGGAVGAIYKFTRALSAREVARLSTRVWQGDLGQFGELG